MVTKIKNLFWYVATFFVAVLFFLLLHPCALYQRYLARNRRREPRLVWGSTPIISYSYWSKAMSKAGFATETFTTAYYSTINKRSDWGRILGEEFKWAWRFSAYPAFLTSLFRYDIFFISFDGYFLGRTPLRYFQSYFFKIARKKVVVLPYGGDSYVYNRIRSVPTIHGLMMSYPVAARNQRSIARDVDYWVEHADAVVTGIMGPDGFGRWDVLMPSPFVISLDQWHVCTRWNELNGKDGKVVVVHAPNHRCFKGTEFIINAIEILNKEGFQVELILLERLQNDEVRRIMREEADILIEQIIFTGHGLNGLEGMASGLPVISNLEQDEYIVPMRRWSYFSECPIVSANPENLVDTLRKLVNRPDLRCKLGKAGRAYVEKYHGFDSAEYLFTNIIDYVFGRKESLINLYHPLIGEYPNRSPKIQHPLVNNRIVD